MKSLIIHTLEVKLQRQIDERDVAEDNFVDAKHIGTKIHIINARVEMVKSYEKVRVTESKLKIAKARGRYESNPAS